MEEHPLRKHLCDGHAVQRCAEFDGVILKPIVSYFTSQAHHIKLITDIFCFQFPGHPKCVHTHHVALPPPLFGGRRHSQFKRRALRTPTSGALARYVVFLAVLARPIHNGTG